MVPFKILVYVKESKKYVQIDKCKSNFLIHIGLNRSKLENNEEIPSWFTYPEIVEELHRIYHPK